MNETLKSNLFKTGQIDIAFVTASDMPIPDQETHLLVKAVESIGLRADIIPWDSASADWSKIPLVVIRTTWDYFKRLPEFMAWARQVDKATQLVNPYAVIEWNSHKRYLLDLSRHGAPVVPTILLEQGTVNDLTGVLEDSGWVELVIKPAVSISALGALRAKAEDITTIRHLENLTVLDHRTC